jgi:hypothetical protein
MHRTILKAAAVATAGGALFAAVTAASSSSPTDLTSVPTANPTAAGYAPANKLSPQLREAVAAQGSTKLENPQGIVDFYGYENTVPSPDNPDLPQMVPTPTTNDEAQKTEPDKNTYLVFSKGLKGADDAYNYGTHFLFQGHENGDGYITRINLDADSDHRVTLLATKDNKGNPLATIDGSTWDPWAHRLIFTTEDNTAPTYAATTDFPSTVTDISGAVGRGGYEGVQNDSAGDLWIVEDIGGDTKAGTKSKRPNSFIYRFVPKSPSDLGNGKLEALQVMNSSGDPITFESQADLHAADQQLLHSYGHSLDTKWVVVHDTATDGHAPFDANALAKAAHATPFKRPENGQFQPGTSFKTFFFDETGDTNADSPENSDAGGWGGVQKLTQDSPTADTGKLTLFYQGDEAHTGLDNVTFLTSRLVTFVEDAGATLHKQRNALDSGYVFDTRSDYSSSANQPLRWLAQGRDASATIDAANGGFGHNEDDNEITGVHVSNGDPTTGGILGAQLPRALQGGWRWFYTQQHGDNVTFEVLSSQTR